MPIANQKQRVILKRYTVPPKLVIEKIPKGKFKRDPVRESPMATALIWSVGIMSALLLVLALIQWERFPPLPTTGGPLIVSAYYPEDIIEDPPLPVSKSERRQANANPHTIIRTTSIAAEWSLADLPEIVVPPYPAQHVSLLPPPDLETGQNLLQAPVNRVASRSSRPSTPASSLPAGQSGHDAESPRYKYNPHPPYPRSAQIARQEGVVILFIKVDDRGLPDYVKVEQSSGYSILDDTASDWVRRKWTFHPARKHGRHIASDVRVPVRFVLKST